jgi:replication factor C subunit 2/4
MLSNIVSFDNTTTIKKKVYNISLPWVEKYRPSKLKDLLLDDIIYNKINFFIKNKEIPNLLLVGEPGTGKTSTILCLLNSIYNNNEIKNNMLELNASDDRGLIMINSKIIPFCKKKGYNNMRKVIILDEADNITQKAQYLIANLINDYIETTSFIFICNNYNNIIESIQSKCFTINYNIINNMNLIKKIKEICTIEKIKYDMDAINYIISKSNNNIREIINNMECIYYSYNKLSIKNIDKLMDTSINVYFDNIIKYSKEKKFIKLVNIIDTLYSKGYLMNNFLILFKNYINNSNIDKIYKIINIINSYYIKINYEKETYMQYLGFISEFYLLF